MAASKRETLLEYLQNTLFPTITTGNGYNFTVATIQRGLKNVRELGDEAFPALFIPGVSEKRNNITVDKFRSVLEVNVVGWVKNSKASLGTTGTGVQLDLDKLIQDITKALEADRKQGNRVYATTITQVDTDDGDVLDLAGCVIRVEFQYATEGSAP